MQDQRPVDGMGAHEMSGGENLTEKNGFYPCAGCGTVRPLAKLKTRITTVKIEMDGQTAEKTTEQKICNDGWCVHAGETTLELR